MAAVGCLEKEIQFQKEAIKEQDVRQAKDRIPTKNIYIRLKTFFFPSKTSRPENRLEYLPVICTCPEPVCSPGIRASIASRMNLPPACCNVRPCRRASTMPRSGNRLVITPAASSLLGTGDARALPFPDHETKSLPARRRRGPAIRTRAKVLWGEGARGRGTLFQKRPPPPEHTQPSPSKTMLQLPHPPPRRHLPKRARPGARRSRKDQASATARAGAP